MVAAAVMRSLLGHRPVPTGSGSEPPSTPDQETPVRAAAALTITLALALGACSGDPAPTETTAGAPADDGGDGAAGGSLTFVGTDDIAWTETSKSTAPGPTEVTIECGEGVNHGLAIEGVRGGEELTACEPGGTGSATIELAAGDYTFFCTVPGHRDAGMEGTLTVTG